MSINTGTSSIMINTVKQANPISALKYTSLPEGASSSVGAGIVLPKSIVVDNFCMKLYNYIMVIIIKIVHACTNTYIAVTHICIV